MADTKIATTTEHVGPYGPRGPESAVLITGSYVADDTDYHAMYFGCYDKRFVTYGIDNPSDQTVTVTIYGSPSATAQVGDVGVFLIGTSVVVTTGTYGYDTTDDGFAFYIMRCVSALAGDDEVVSLFVHLFR